MARYNGPKARINRRLSSLIYENSGAVRAMERRDNHRVCTAARDGPRTTVWRWRRSRNQALLWAWGAATAPAVR